MAQSNGEHQSDGSTANPSKLVCKRCGQTYTYQALGSFGCPGYHQAQSNGDGLRKGTGGSFWRRATMTAGDQADGGDTWHISKKDFNEYLIELDEIILADRKQHELDARINELISYGREVGLLDSRVKTALHERIEKLKAEREAL